MHIGKTKYNKEKNQNETHTNALSFLGFSRNSIFISSNVKESIFQLSKSIIQIYIILILFFLGSN